jgi:hypothetical protein
MEGSRRSRITTIGGYSTSSDTPPKSRSNRTREHFGTQAATRKFNLEQRRKICADSKAISTG